MRFLWQKKIKRKDIAKGKEANLCNLSFDVFKRKTRSQAADRLNSFDLCIEYGLKFAKFLRKNISDKNLLDVILANFSEKDTNYVNAFYRHFTPLTRDVYCTVENYENEK